MSRNINRRPLLLPFWVCNPKSFALLSLAAILWLFYFPMLGHAKKKSTPSTTVHYSVKDLPPFVSKMHKAIYRAARSGDLEMMRTVLETNELLPLIKDKLIRKPVDHWMKQSRAGDGLSVFANISKILEAGYVKQKDKRGMALYIWPYFSKVNLKKLEPQQKVQFYRMVSEEKALEMMKSGRYTFHSLGIGEDGTWHYFW